MTPYRAIILDLDGTLVDSNDAHARAWVHAFTDEDFSVSFAQVRPLIGMGGDQLSETAGYEPCTLVQVFQKSCLEQAC